MVLRINGNVDFATIGELKRYITDVLGLPSGSFKFVTPNGGSAQNTTDAEDFFRSTWGVEDLTNAEGFTYHAASTITVNSLKENIASRLRVPLESIRMVWSDNTDVAGNTLVENFRNNW